MSQEIDVETLKQNLMPVKVNPGVDKDRLTVLFQVRHEHCCEDPVHFDLKFSELLETDVEPWTIRLEAREEPVLLNLGGFTSNPQDAGFILIRNTEKASETGLQPTDEEIAELKHKNIVVYFNGEAGPVVRPGRFFFSEVKDIQKVSIGSTRGRVKGRLNILPK